MDKEAKYLQTMLDASEVTIRSQQRTMEMMNKIINRMDYEIDELEAQLKEKGGKK